MSAITRLTRLTRLNETLDSVTADPRTKPGLEKIWEFINRVSTVDQEMARRFAGLVLTQGTPHE